MHDRNDIPTTIPMFVGSSKTEKPVRIMGIAVGILLLSRIQAEIYVITLPVHDGHL